MTPTERRRAAATIARSTKSCAAGPSGAFAVAGIATAIVVAHLLRLLLLRLPAAGSRAVSAAAAPLDAPRLACGRRRRRAALGDRRRRHHRAAGRDDGVHRAALGRDAAVARRDRSTRARCTSRASSSRAISARRVGADGKVIGAPRSRSSIRSSRSASSCPPEMPVTFRGTSTDVDPRLRRRHDQRQHDAGPGLRRHVHDDVPKTGEHLMPCHEYCGTGHEAMWARVQVLPRAGVPRARRAAEKG